MGLLPTRYAYREALVQLGAASAGEGLVGIAKVFTARQPISCQ